MKNSRSEGFLLAKHLKHTAHKHHHHDGAVFPSSGRAYPTPGHLCGRGWARSSSNGLVLNYKLKEKKNYFYCLSVSVNYNNCSPAVGNDSQNGIHCRWRATIIYELTKNIIMNNSVACCYTSFRLIHNILNNTKGKCTTSRRSFGLFWRESKNSSFCSLRREWKHRTRKNSSVS